MRFSLAAALLLFASALIAAPTITSISPSEGPVTGGTLVTIHGGGFRNDCPVNPPCNTLTVTFGGVTATSFNLVDSNTITATTPVHFPGKVAIAVYQTDGVATASDAFTYVGDVTDAFDRILLPIFTPPVYGAYGSQFVTNYSIWNGSQTPAAVYGLAPPCATLCVPTLGPIDLPPGRGTAPQSGFFLTGTPTAPGVFIYIPQTAASFIYSELRVQDVSRQAQTWGTEIPVVHDRDFRPFMTALLNIPNDSRFRNTLRVYGDGPGTVFVRIVGDTPPTGTVAEFTLQLAPGRSMFDPAYAAFSAFPAPPITTGPAVSTMHIEIEPSTYLLRIWAFVSVTNNETQHITIISPH